MSRQPPFEQTLFLQADGLASIPGLVHGFTTRHGGASKSPFDTANYGLGIEDDPASVEENLSRLGRRAGFPVDRLYTMQQVHGADVVRVSSADVPEVVARRQADALLTCERNTFLAVRTADCVAILLVDSGGQGCAAVHAGWRGTARRVIVRAVEALRRELGVPVASLRAALGPSIGPCCFEVGPEVVEALRAAVPGPEAAWRDDATPDGKFRVDLRAANAAMLARVGVTAVERVGECTSCNEFDFFSHRRDRGRTGRMLAFVGFGG